MADLNAVFSHVFETFGIRGLNAYQREAIVKFVQKKTDVFVNLPTGYGKSLIYQALPFVCDSIFEAAGQYTGSASSISENRRIIRICMGIQRICVKW